MFLVSPLIYVLGFFVSSSLRFLAIYMAQFPLFAKEEESLKNAGAMILPRVLVAFPPAKLASVLKEVRSSFTP